MSKKQWLVLLMLFLTYLLLGASIFYHIESRLEIENVKRAKEERIEINALLHEHYMLSRTHSQHEILEKLTQYCGKSVYNYTEGETDPLKWDFYNSFYFAYTVVSTIGYGNLAPTNMLGRILMIFYGLVGIPMNGILLTQLGEFFGQVFVKAHQKYKSYKAERNNYYDKKLETRRAGLAAQIFVYLTPGFIMFIFFPAFLFSHYEGWSYDEAVYYAFVTLTTIGFGDYVAGQDNTKGSGVFFILYKTFLICWISFGLGYIVMIMTFISRGMRSKKIIQIEHKLAMNLKHTQNKIWNEFNKEVNYLRRVFNELQLSKVKRVYVDEGDYDVPPSKFPRSSSFPDLRDLTFGSIDTPSTPHPRRRANSEVVPTEEQLTRVVSETDLQRIDKNATFAAHAIVQPAELFAKLVNVLGYVPPPSADNNDPFDWETNVGHNSDKKLRRKTIGVDGFSEKEILASENTWNGSSWKYGNDRFFPAFKPRSRAASEVRLGDTRSGMGGELNGSVGRQNGEWTWSGPGTTRKIQEFIKNHSAGLSNQSADSKARKFPSLSLPISMPKGLIPRWKRQTSKDKKDSTQSGPITDSRDNLQDSYVSHPSGVADTYAGRSSFSFDTERSDSLSRKFYYTHTGASNMPGLFEGSSSILEETSLGDFLRALTVIHSTVGALPGDYAPKPKRKMGTASLSPPKLPSLFTLFTGAGNGPGTGSGNATPSGVHSNQTTVTGTPAHQQIRRLSLWNSDNNSDSSVPSYARRRSLVPAVSRKPRRFSLRPVATPVGTPPNAPGSPCLSARHFPAAIDQSTLPANSSFVDESQKKPLVKMEGAPGVSSPVTSSPTASTSNLSARPTARRFSLRPAQIGMPPAPRSSNTSSVVPVSATSSVPTVPTAATATVPTAPIKPLPRWKAGMLERKIGRMSVRRRARAFSLSDVQTERPERLNELSPLAADIKSAMLSIGPHESFDRPGNKRNTAGGQKTVTIVSPGASTADAKPWNYPRTSLTSLTSSNLFDDTAGTPRSYASTPTVTSTPMVIQPVAKNEYVATRILDPSMQTSNYSLASGSVAGEGGPNPLVPDTPTPPSFGTFTENGGGIIAGNLLSLSRAPGDEEIRRTQVLTTEVDSSGLNNKSQTSAVMEQQRDAQTVVTITSANEPAEWIPQTKSNDDLTEVKVDKLEENLSGGESRDLPKENT